MDAIHTGIKVTNVYELLIFTNFCNSKLTKFLSNFKTVGAAFISFLRPLV
jgi:hypothetical protein